MTIPEKITEIARDLRRNMIHSEKLLWQKLRARKLGVKFLRQHPLNIFTEDTQQERCIIVDFYSHEAKLVIELDGNIHDIPEVLALDAEKKILLKSQGFQILRFHNDKIEGDIIDVLKTIQKSINM